MQEQDPSDPADGAQLEQEMLEQMATLRALYAEKQRLEALAKSQASALQQQRDMLLRLRQLEQSAGVSGNNPEEVDTDDGDGDEDAEDEDDGAGSDGDGDGGDVEGMEGLIAHLRTLEPRDGTRTDDGGSGGVQHGASSAAAVESRAAASSPDSEEAARRMLEDALREREELMQRMRELQMLQMMLQQQQDGGVDEGEDGERGASPERPESDGSPVVSRSRDAHEGKGMEEAKGSQRRRVVAATSARGGDDDDDDDDDGERGSDDDGEPGEEDVLALMQQLQELQAMREVRPRRCPAFVLTRGV